MYFVNVFFVFSMVGFIWEKLLEIIKGGVKVGILFGPWVPLYGVGAIVIIFLNRFLKRKNFQMFWEKVIFFGATALIFTVLEFITGNLIELISGEVLWDYSKAWFNYGKYICLEVSLCWGVVALVFNYYIYPRIRKYVDKIPDKISVGMIAAFGVDIILKLLL